MPLNKRLLAACFFVCLGIFAIGVFVGWLVHIPSILLPPSVNVNAGVLEKFRVAAAFRTILLNNTRVFLMLTVGILTCGLLSVVEAVFIGAMVGFLAKISSQQGVQASVIGAALLPHGVLELASFLIVASMGIYLAVRIYHASKGEQINWGTGARGYLLTIAAAYVILDVAALLETYVTPLAVAKLLK